MGGVRVCRIVCDLFHDMHLGFYVTALSLLLPKESAVDGNTGKNLLRCI